MYIDFSKRGEKFGPNIFNVLEEKRQERINNNLSVYNFSVGTPDFKPSTEVMELVSKAALDSENYKYSLGDSKELLDSVIRWYKKRYNVDLNHNQISSVFGTQEGMAHVCLGLVNPGDLVLVPNPGYPIFEIGPFLCGAEVAYYNLYPENGYLIDFENFDEELAKRAKVMVVSYPLNPVGAIANPKFYEDLVAFAKKYNIVIIHDNAYSEIIYDGNVGGSFLATDGAMDVGVEFNSLSKSYNLTGLRLSFLIGNEDIVKSFKSIRSQYDYGTSYIYQKAAIAALDGDQSYVKENCARYEKRRDVLEANLHKLGLKPMGSKGSMFVWAKILDENVNSTDFVINTLEKYGILCTPGTSFGSLGEGYVRFALVIPAWKIEEIFGELQEVADVL